jgi:hypothetical protein
MLLRLPRFLRDIEWYWWVVWLMGLVILLAIAIPRYWLGMLQEPEFGTLFGVLASFVLVTFFTNRLLISGLQNTVTQALGIAFSRGEAGLFNHLERQTRALIVENALTASLGQTYGGSVFKEVVRDYIEGDRDYRAKFNYEIACLDRLGGAPTPFVSKLEGLFPPQDYLWVGQDLVFTQHGFQRERSLLHLTARIALNSAQFEEAVRDPFLYFREFLQLDDKARAWIEALHEDELRKVLADCFDLGVFAPDGRPVGYTVGWQGDKVVGKSISLTIDNHNGLNEGSGCRLRFRLPHRRDATFFVVTMPKPTEEGARITFTRAPSMSGLAPVVYLPRRSFMLRKLDGDGDHNPARVEIETTSWTFPTGGITFTWRN